MSDISHTHTQRATVPALEERLYKTFPVLDHGFIRIIDYMGNDNAIVQAARVSYGKGTKHTSQDAGLIRYLMRYYHTTPFEMCEIKFHIKLPIFVARQWVRHRTANINEYSGRYSVMAKEFYVPSMDQLAPQSVVNNQGREDKTVTPEQGAQILEWIRNDAEQCYNHYQHMIDGNYPGIQDETDSLDQVNKKGLARELARMNLTLNYYTEWYWKIDLHNLFHFLMLRADSHAQYEIRVYADLLLEIAKDWVPLAYQAFMDYRMHAQHFSAQGMDVVKRLLEGEIVTQETSHMSAREWRELSSVLGLSS